MQRTLLHGKIHRATVTGADLDYVGSISLDRSLINAAGLFEWERVQVVDVTNGARLETYVIPAPAGSGVVQLNGAAAHLVSVGDKVIIMAYGQMAEAEARGFQPTVVHVDAENQVTEVVEGGEAGPADAPRLAA